MTNRIQGDTIKFQENASEGEFNILQIRYGALPLNKSDLEEIDEDSNLGFENLSQREEAKAMEPIPKEDPLWDIVENPVDLGVETDASTEEEEKTI